MKHIRVASARSDVKGIKVVLRGGMQRWGDYTSLIRKSKVTIDLQALLDRGGIGLGIRSCLTFSRIVGSAFKIPRERTDGKRETERMR